MKAPLGEVSDIQVGYQSRESIHSHANGSHWLIQARDFNKVHQVEWSNLIRFTPSGNTSKPELRLGDILFLAKGHKNFAYLVNRKVDNVLAANTFYILRANPESILPEFLSWWLNQTPAQEYIKLNRSGSSLLFVSVTTLSRLEVPIPEIAMQQKIVELQALKLRETDLLNQFLAKRSALIEAVCLRAIVE